MDDLLQDMIDRGLAEIDTNPKHKMALALIAFDSPKMTGDWLDWLDWLKCNSN